MVAAGRWSLTTGTLVIEIIPSGDCGRPRRVVAQTRGRPRQVLLCLGSLSANEGVSQADVNNYRIIIGWMKWKGLSGVMCDMKIPVELKDKVFKAIIRQEMTYGSECWAVKGQMRANE